jgi:uncharacterized membrane protein YhaH (DUF805 family)
MLKGRMNRAGYWLCVAIIAVLYFAMNFVFRTRTPISEVVLIFLCVPRLHDIGRSGWLVLIPLALEVGGAIAAFSSLPPGTGLAVMGVIVLLIAGLIIWLGCVRGDQSANRFGEAPSPGIEFKRASV